MFTTFWFMIHNFGCRYARKPIKGNKDLDDGLVSKTSMSEKIGLLDWHLRQGKVGQPPHTCGAPQENPKPKTEIFFQSKLDVLQNPQMVWTPL